jgi:hypothetical protein
MAAETGELPGTETPGGARPRYVFLRAVRELAGPEGAKARTFTAAGRVVWAPGQVSAWRSGREDHSRERRADPAHPVPGASCAFADGFVTRTPA